MARFTPALRDLSWLVDRPIAHRGLHNAPQGIIENSASAFAAALAGGYHIECDVQLSADGWPMVFHDEDLERLTEARGSVIARSAQELQKIPLRHSRDYMQTLPELCEQVGARVTLVVELKSLWNGDTRLSDSVIAAVKDYRGPICFMSFDPRLIAALAVRAPELVRGIVSDRMTHAEYRSLSFGERLSLRHFSHLATSQPQFISYNWRDLPFSAVSQIREAGLPVITWTIRSAQQAAQARRYCDQITFEGFLP